MLERNIRDRDASIELLEDRHKEYVSVAKIMIAGFCISVVLTVFASLFTGSYILEEISIHENIGNEAIMITITGVYFYIGFFIAIMFLGIMAIYYHMEAKKYQIFIYLKHILEQKNKKGK